MRFPTRLILPGLVAGAALVLVPLVLDAVLVAPHALFISHPARAGEVYLVNRSASSEEVTVELRYGYPATDSAGEVMIAWPEAGPDDRRASGWLRAFPRQVRVEPGQRQLVRILASPPADLPDGEYWSRMIVTSRAVQPQVAVTGDSAVQAGLTLELRTITSVSYRKGQVRTGVRLDDLRVTAEGDTLVAWVALAREGNAAYLGQVHFQMRDTTERTIAEWRTPIAVYHSMNRRFAMAVDTLPPGTYRVQFDLTTDREDIPLDVVLPADSIRRSVGVEVR